MQERLGPKLSSLGLSVDDQIGVICATLREAWIPAPAEVQLPTGAEKAASLAEFIGLAWKDLDHPCSERVIARALAFAVTRAAAFDPSAAVLAQGFVERVSTGLLLLQVGHELLGGEFLEVAEVWAARG